MTNQNPVLPVGYSPLPPGHLANLVTFLEMTARPSLSPGLPAGYDLVRVTSAGRDAYKLLFRTVGEDWLWFSRLSMSDEKLAAVLDDPLVEGYALRRDAADVGMLELDFRVAGQCEIVYFGLAAGAIGKGVGRTLMNNAIAIAWSKPIERLWLHTCHFDSPQALDFYKRSGFKAYKFEVEVHPDPRLTGALPRHAAPHVPMVELG